MKLATAPEAEALPSKSLSSAAASMGSWVRRNMLTASDRREECDFITVRNLEAIGNERCIHCDPDGSFFKSAAKAAHVVQPETQCASARNAGWQWQSLGSRASQITKFSQIHYLRHVS